MREDTLLTGTLEPTNEPYAIAKIAGIKLCESYNRQYGASHGVDYRSVMSTNLYGPGDNFHPENSHVVPALIRRFHGAVISNAPEVVIWGSGKPYREFLHVDDMAEASLFVLDLPRDRYNANTLPMLSHINVGTGQEVTIAELAESIAQITGFSGKIVFDATKPDGTPRKLMDVTRLRNMGWSAKIDLHEGLKDTYRWYQKSVVRSVWVCNITLFCKRDIAGYLSFSSFAGHKYPQNVLCHLRPDKNQIICDVTFHPLI